ncbi:MULTISPECIES: precorrin-3B synthase [Rhizobium]|uniref:precorrin-3B synthase n=1 Tax=Rhizobium TaxID=379 RepID=UPI0007E9F27E|nr:MULTISPECIES: precorrin-3B synthase [Rhizobium]ANK94880.1 precorrin-3B synthase [Rhizobium sp. N6212]ANL00930.1 precorrin-3B synthase [Rhizobium sp. N621]ANL07051.1 precorrin-3B synthase [Rhizobium esperanzae]ANL13221.1 precorrin-3B synthase [Rhizobium sp. N1341]ANL25204.1 precorrin-3B synthase [Rhizobium sp. N113]
MGTKAAKAIDRTGEADLDDRPLAKPRPRGACPALAAPMPTGDGLLVRLRPAGGALILSQFSALARSAAEHGNGIVEITARGNLQIRGLRVETVRRLAADIDAAGIAVPDGPAIEISPLHGIDPEEISDPAVLEQALRSTLGERLASPRLAPKLSLIIDGGGAFGLSALPADIRIVARPGAQWLVAINGDGETATPVAKGAAEAAISAVGEILELLAVRQSRRARDIDPALLRARFPAMDAIRFRPSHRAKMPLSGLHRLKNGKHVLGVRPEFGQMRASDLTTLFDEAKAHGATAIRLAPGRGFFFTDFPAGAAPAMQITASKHGFSVQSGEKCEYIAACAGAGACGSAFFETGTLARRILAAAPDLFDGSLMLHLSGCAKGCAHPRPALTLTGTSEGYDLILNGLAMDRPDERIAGGRIDFAIERLARSIEDNRGAGESTAACLKRLGATGVAKALRQG